MINNCNYEEGCSLPSSSNELIVLYRQIKREIKELSSSTEAKLLCHDGKIAEVCKYIKDNLSNTIRCMLDDMNLSGELDSIISESILNELELIKNNTNLFINVKSYGVIGDGKVDDTLAIQTLIDTNPYSTIYFPKGNYKISAPIKTNSDNDQKQTIILDKMATIFTDNNIECLFELGANGSNKGNIDLRLKQFKGGILNANNCISAIKINGNAQSFDISECEIINFTTYGIYIPKSSNVTSSDVIVRDCYISGKSSINNNYGIYTERPDNKFVNLRINAVKKCISTDAGGLFIDNVHGLYISYMNEIPTNFNESVFLEIKGGGENFINNSYCDTFSCFVNTASSAPFILTNSMYYSYLNNVDITLFKFNNELSKCTIKNNRFKMPTPKNKHKGILFEHFNSQYYRDSFMIIEDNNINLSDLFVNGDIINKCNKTYVPYWLNAGVNLPTDKWLKVGYTFTSFNYMDLKLSIDGYIYNMRGKLEKYGVNTYLTDRVHNKNYEATIKVGFKYEHSINGYDVYGIYLKQVSGTPLKSDIEVEIENNSNPLIQINNSLINRVMEELTMDVETTI